MNPFPVILEKMEFSVAMSPNTRKEKVIPYLVIDVFDTADAPLALLDSGEKQVVPRKSPSPIRYWLARCAKQEHDLGPDSGKQNPVQGRKIALR